MSMQHTRSILLRQRTMIAAALIVAIGHSAQARSHRHVPSHVPRSVQIDDTDETQNDVDHDRLSREITRDPVTLCALSENRCVKAIMRDDPMIEPNDMDDDQ